MAIAGYTWSPLFDLFDWSYRTGDAAPSHYLERLGLGAWAVHRSETVFEPAVVGFDAFVGPSFDVMPRGREKFAGAFRKRSPRRHVA